jgi:hypothetical protein
MQQHSSDFFRLFVFSSADCFISFLDNNVHLIRSRDQHTDIGSSRTGSLLLLAAPCTNTQESRSPFFIRV